MVPLLKVLPDSFVEERTVPGQLSEYIGGPQVTTAWQDAFALVVISGQPNMIGARLSTTVTLNEQVAVFPAASLAV